MSVKLKEKPIATYSTTSLLEMRDQLSRAKKGKRNAQKIKNQLTKRGIK